ncbi:MAG: hypothetical protein ACOYON_08200 [Fimbriimonas sp.]
MRLRHLLLIWLLVLPQIHWCPPSFRLLDGSPCFTCPSLTQIEAAQDEHQNLASGEHGDCHDCCTLQACEKETKAQPNLIQASLLFIDIPPTIRIAIIRPPEVETSIPTFKAGCPPTGPPDESASRAPPFSQLV